MLAVNTYDASTLLLIAFVCIAAFIDIREHRIPNYLTFSLLALGLSSQLYFVGWTGLLTAFGGALTGLLIFLPFWLLGGMGAGDVKIMAAIGTFTGAYQMLLTAALVLSCGFVFAVGFLIARGDMLQFLKRNGLTAKVLLLTGQWIYQPPEPGEAAAHRFPFGVAIAGGTIAWLGWVSALQFSHLRELFAWGAA